MPSSVSTVGMMSGLSKDGLTWDECAARWKLSVNAVRTRAKQLGIPVAYIDRIAHWPGDLIEFGDAFHEWREEFPYEKVEVFLEKVGAPSPEQTKEEISGTLAKKGDAERAAELMVAGMKSMASELKLLQKDDTPPPLLRAKLLAEMADNDLVVTNGELKAIGVNTGSREGDHFEAYGYAFTAHRHHTNVNAERFWTCERMFTKKAQAPLVQSTGRSVGFVADEPTAAMFNFNQPVLPHWS